MTKTPTGRARLRPIRQRAVLRGSPGDEQPTLAAYYAAAAQGISVAGERAGKPTLRLVVGWLDGHAARGRRRTGCGGEGNQRARQTGRGRARPCSDREALPLHHPSTSLPGAPDGVARTVASSSS